MAMLRVFTVISVFIVCEGHLESILQRKLSRLQGSGPYNSWQVTEYQTYNGFQGSPALSPENIVIAEVDPRPNYASIQNQRYPVIGNQYQGSPNVLQGTWNPGVQNRKPQEETVVVVVYDDQPSKTPQQPQNLPPFVNYQSNYKPTPPNNLNTDAMVLNQIVSYINQQQNRGNQQNYPHQYNNGGQLVSENNDNKGLKGQNDSNGKRPTYSNQYPDQGIDKKPILEDTHDSKGSQKPTTNKKGPNYPNNNENHFIGTTSERNVNSANDGTGGDEEFSIDVRTSIDEESKRNK